MDLSPYGLRAFTNIHPSAMKPSKIAATAGKVSHMCMMDFDDELVCGRLQLPLRQ